MKEIKKMNTRVFHFSGGRTSAMMTLTAYKPGDMVIFCDTGREVAGTYEFIDVFEKMEGIKIIRIGGKNVFRELIIKRKAIPNRFSRFCTVELKIKAARRYLRSIGIKNYTQFIGFRADEQERISSYKEYWKTVETKFPLNEMGVTKNDVLQFWENKSYNLDIPSILGNCSLCFQKGKNAILKILSQYPELAKEWIEDEEIIGKTYLKGVSMKTLLELSRGLKQYNLFEAQPEFNCACTT